MPEDPRTTLSKEMDEAWELDGVKTPNQVTTEEVWRRGFLAGYVAGIDRGMEIEHQFNQELEDELKKEDI